MQKGILKNVLCWLIYSIHAILLHLKWYNLILEKIYPWLHQAYLTSEYVKKKKILHNNLFLASSGVKSAMVPEKKFKVPLISLAFCITFEKFIACISIAKVFSLCLECALLCRWQLSLSNQTQIGTLTEQGWALVYDLKQRVTLDVCCGMPNR